MFHVKRKRYDYDLIVIGSGSGGSVGAHHARSLGKRVALFECGEIGGECPNFACVPTKALLHAGEVYQDIKNAKIFGINTSDLSLDYSILHKWKNLVVSRTGTTHGEESFRKSGIHLFRAKARFVSPHEVEADGKIISASKFLIATGSKVFIPSITGITEAGFITFKEAVNLTKLPSSILIFGAGPVGCELAQIFNTFGAKVTLVNRSEKILGKEDTEVVDLVQALFENQGIRVMTGASLIKVEKNNDKKIAHLEKRGKEFFDEFEQILISTGKVPVLDFAPEKAGVELNNGHLKLNRYLQTTASHIFAAGDIAGPYLFTHTGYYQSYIASHNAFSNKKIKPDYSVVPRCVFITPEVSSVGISEKEAKEKDMPIKKGIMALAELGRSNTANAFDGFVKIITNKKGVIIGGSIVAPRAGEMIHEIALAIKCRVKAQELADMIHAYPTYSEGIKIACSNVE